MGIRAVVVEGRVALATPEGRVEVPAGSVGFAAPGAQPDLRPGGGRPLPSGLARRAVGLP